MLNYTNLKFFNKTGYEIPISYNTNFKIGIKDDFNSEDIFYGILMPDSQSTTGYNVVGYKKYRVSGKYNSDKQNIPATFTLNNKQLAGTVNCEFSQLNAFSSYTDSNYKNIRRIVSTSITNDILQQYNVNFPTVTLSGDLTFNKVSTELIETETIYILGENDNGGIEPLQNIWGSDDFKNRYKLLFYIDTRNQQDFRFFTVENDEVIWTNKIILPLNDNNSDLRVDIGFKASEEGIYNENIIICLLDTSVSEDDPLYIIPICTMNMSAETIGEDERYRTLFQNFGLPHPYEYYNTFADSDSKEAYIDNISLNEKTKKMFLSYTDIFPYVGSYKALINAVKTLGYDDIFFKEWYKKSTVTGNDHISIDVTHDDNSIINTIKNLSIDERIKLKKLNKLSMIYKINKELVDKAPDEYGFPTSIQVKGYANNEITVKLIALKSWLEKYILGVNCHITDVGGEGIFFERYKSDIYGTYQSILEYNNEHNLSPYIIESDDSNVLVDSSTDININIGVDEFKGLTLNDLKDKRFIDFCSGYIDNTGIYHDISDNMADDASVYISDCIANINKTNLETFEIKGSCKTNTFLFNNDFMANEIIYEKEDGSECTYKSAGLRIANNEIKFNPIDLYNGAVKESIFKDAPVILVEKAKLRDIDYIADIDPEKTTIKFLRQNISYTASLDPRSFDTEVLMYNQYSSIFSGAVRGTISNNKLPLPTSHVNSFIRPLCSITLPKRNNSRQTITKINNIPITISGSWNRTEIIIETLGEEGQHQQTDSNKILADLTESLQIYPENVEIINDLNNNYNIRMRLYYAVSKTPINTMWDDNYFNNTNHIGDIISTMIDNYNTIYGSEEVEKENNYDYFVSYVENKKDSEHVTDIGFFEDSGQYYFEFELDFSNMNILETLNKNDENYNVVDVPEEDRTFYVYYYITLINTVTGEPLNTTYTPPGNLDYNTLGPYSYNLYFKYDGNSPNELPYGTQRGITIYGGNAEIIESPEHTEHTKTVKRILNDWERSACYTIKPSDNKTSSYDFITTIEDQHTGEITNETITVNDYIEFIPPVVDDSNLSTQNKLTLKPFSYETIDDVEITNIISEKINNSALDVNENGQKGINSNLTHGLKYSANNIINIPFFNIYGYQISNPEITKNIRPDHEYILDIQDGKMIFPDIKHNRVIYLNFTYDEAQQKQYVNTTIEYISDEFKITEYNDGANTFNHFYVGKDYSDFINKYNNDIEDAIKLNYEHPIKVYNTGEYNIDVIARDLQNNIFAAKCLNTTKIKLDDFNINLYSDELCINPVNNNEPSTVLDEDLNIIKNDYIDFCLYGYNPLISNIKIDYNEFFTDKPNVADVRYPIYNKFIHNHNTDNKFVHFMNLSDRFNINAIDYVNTTISNTENNAVFESFGLVGDLPIFTNNNYIDKYKNNIIKSLNDNNIPNNLTASEILTNTKNNTNYNYADINLTAYNELGGYPVFQTHAQMAHNMALKKNSNIDKFRIISSDTTHNDYLYTSLAVSAENKIIQDFANEILDTFTNTEDNLISRVEYYKKYRKNTHVINPTDEELEEISTDENFTKKIVYITEPNLSENIDEKISLELSYLLINHIKNCENNISLNDVNSMQLSNFMDTTVIPADSSTEPSTVLYHGQYAGFTYVCDLESEHIDSVSDNIDVVEFLRMPFNNTTTDYYKHLNNIKELEYYDNEILSVITDLDVTLNYNNDNDNRIHQISDIGNPEHCSHAYPYVIAPEIIILEKTGSSEKPGTVEYPFKEKNNSNEYKPIELELYHTICNSYIQDVYKNNEDYIIDCELQYLKQKFHYDTNTVSSTLVEIFNEILLSIVPGNELTIKERIENYLDDDYVINEDHIKIVLKTINDLLIKKGNNININIFNELVINIYNNLCKVSELFTVVNEDEGNAGVSCLRDFTDVTTPGQTMKFFFQTSSSRFLFKTQASGTIGSGIHRKFVRKIDDYLNNIDPSNEEENTKAYIKILFLMYSYFGVCFFYDIYLINKNTLGTNFPLNDTFGNDYNPLFKFISLIDVNIIGRCMHVLKSYGTAYLNTFIPDSIDSQEEQIPEEGDDINLGDTETSNNKKLYDYIKSDIFDINRYTSPTTVISIYSKMLSGYIKDDFETNKSNNIIMIGNPVSSQLSEPLYNLIKYAITYKESSVESSELDSIKYIKSPTSKNLLFNSPSEEISDIKYNHSVKDLLLNNYTSVYVNPTWRNSIQLSKIQGETSLFKAVQEYDIFNMNFKENDNIKLILENKDTPDQIGQASYKIKDIENGTLNLYGIINEKYLLDDNVNLYQPLVYDNNTEIKNLYINYAGKNITTSTSTLNPNESGYGRNMSLIWLDVNDNNINNLKNSVFINKSDAEIDAMLYHIDDTENKGIFLYNILGSPSINNIVANSIYTNNPYNVPAFVYISPQHHSFVDYVFKNTNIEKANAEGKIVFNTEDKKEQSVLDFIDDKFSISISDFDINNGISTWMSGDTEEITSDDETTTINNIPNIIKSNYIYKYKNGEPVTLSSTRNLVLTPNLSELFNREDIYIKWSIYRTEPTKTNKELFFESYNKTLYLDIDKEGSYDIDLELFDNMGNSTTKTFNGIFSVV